MLPARPLWYNDHETLPQRKRRRIKMEQKTQPHSSGGTAPLHLPKKARVDAAVRGQPVDRPPVSLWRHFYECEDTAEGLAGAMLAWHRKYDWDWMKINPRASYHVEGWGVKLRFSGEPLIKPVVLDVPIKQTRDWATLRP